jgi:hypothetical protein
MFWFPAIRTFLFVVCAQMSALRVVVDAKQQYSKWSTLVVMSVYVHTWASSIFFPIAFLYFLCTMQFWVVAGMLAVTIFAFIVPIKQNNHVREWLAEKSVNYFKYVLPCKHSLSLFIGVFFYYFILKKSTFSFDVLNIFLFFFCCDLHANWIRYRSFVLVYERMPKKDAPTILCVHPHGIMALGWATLFLRPELDHVYFCFSEFLFRTPLFRYLFIYLLLLPHTVWRIKFFVAEFWFPSSVALALFQSNF